MHGGEREPSRVYPPVDICDGDTSLIAKGCRHCENELMVIPKDERIFLHAFRYKSHHFDLKIEWPEWSKDVS